METIEITASPHSGQGYEGRLGKDLTILGRFASFQLRMLRESLVRRAEKPCVQFLERSQVVGLLNSLQSKVGHRSVMHAANLHIIGVLFIRASAEENVFHLRSGYLCLADSARFMVRWDNILWVQSGECTRSGI